MCWNTIHMYTTWTRHEKDFAKSIFLFVQFYIEFTLRCVRVHTFSLNGMQVVQAIVSCMRDCTKRMQTIRRLIHLCESAIHLTWTSFLFCIILSSHIFALYVKRSLKWNNNNISQVKGGLIWMLKWLTVTFI